jgi:RNA polymerase sigma factor (TIGR02999 family)
MAEIRPGATEPPRPTSLDEALPPLLDELRVLARRALAREHAAPTLQTTDLIHEAYLRLAHDPGVVARGRAYFWAAAARAMRQVLIDAARRRRATRRGGGAIVVPLDAVPLDQAPAVTDTLGDELLALETALAELEARNPRHARVVECRFFGGMTVEDTAAALGVSARTVKADWALARAWLRETLHARGVDT